MGSNAVWPQIFSTVLTSSHCHLFCLAAGTDCLHILPVRQFNEISKDIVWG
ncbi:hypothetical protein DPMN_058421 [Dreissena polymorpha]|uniref:Uncharacterized protein n=1 Tax=Dreissena polymorpha TaxID=45954 RepID=A0A9D4C248_DREPO|nr:hypothetical protein DPMN_058421 [Dreissena polymorpha]